MYVLCKVSIFGNKHCEPTMHFYNSFFVIPPVGNMKCLSKETQLINFCLLILLSFPLFITVIMNEPYILLARKYRKKGYYIIKD